MVSRFDRGHTARYHILRPVQAQTPGLAACSVFPVTPACDTEPRHTGQGMSGWRMAAKPKDASDPMFESYAQLAQGLIGELSAACLLDGEWRVRGSTGRIVLPAVKKWVDELGWSGTLARQPVAIALAPGEWVTAIPLEQSDTTLLGAFCVQQTIGNPASYPARYAADLARRLKPLLDCIYRELAANIPVRERTQTMTDRTSELEWLFKVTSNIKGGADDRYAIKELLAAATERLGSAMGVCCDSGQAYLHRVHARRTRGCAEQRLGRNAGAAWRVGPNEPASAQLGAATQYAAGDQQRRPKRRQDPPLQDPVGARGARLRQGHRRAGVHQSAVRGGLCESSRVSREASGCAGGQRRRYAIRSHDRSVYARARSNKPMPISRRTRTARQAVWHIWTSTTCTWSTNSMGSKSAMN